jgi:alkylated DNA repair dioxygenase AlkB
MSSEWVPLLASAFGPDSMENCFAQTPFEPFAKNLGFGLFVIRAAMVPDKAQRIQENLHIHMEKIGLETGVRAIQAKANRGIHYYNTMQVVTGHCTCKYEYETTAKHPLFHLKDVPPLETATSWLKDKCKAPPEQMFNEIVANDYSRNRNDAISWHTDKNCLLRKATDIVSLSMGAPGIFCYQPDTRSVDQFREFNISRGGEAQRRDAMINKGLRGFVPVFSGDILLMSGTFQEYLCHKTLRFTEVAAPEDLLLKYPGSNANSKRLLPDALSRNPKCDRACITWRLITNHNRLCPDGRPSGQPDAKVVADLVQSQNVCQKRLIFDPAAVNGLKSSTLKEMLKANGIAIPTGTCEKDELIKLLIDHTPSLSPTVICPVQGSVGNPASGSAELEVPCNPVPEVDVDAATDPKDIAQDQVIAKITEAREFVDSVEEVLKKYDHILQCADTDDRMAIERIIMKLSQKLMEGQRVKVLAEISQEAAEGFSQLQYFEGSYGAILESKPANDKGLSWRKGVCGDKKSRCLRILTTTRNVLSFIHNVDVTYSKSNEGVVLDRRVPPSENMYFLQEGVANLISFKNAVRFKSFELGLNYNVISTRYILQPLPKNGATTEEMNARYGRFYELLTGVIISEKKRQKNIEVTSAWPLLIPWKVANVFDMPMVLWIYKEKE